MLTFVYIGREFSEAAKRGCLLWNVKVGTGFSELIKRRLVGHRRSIGTFRKPRVQIHPAC
jgi:hypothetical protein